LLAGSCQLLQELYQLKNKNKQLKNKDFYPIKEKRILVIHENSSS